MDHIGAVSGLHGGYRGGGLLGSGRIVESQLENGMESRII